MSELFKNLPGPSSSEAPKEAVVAKPVEKPAERVVAKEAVTEALDEVKAAQEAPVDETEEDIEPEEIEKPDELTMLKQRAQMMGITFSNNIGLEALKTKIQEKMTPPPVVEDEEDEPEEITEVLAPVQFNNQEGQTNIAPTKMKLRERLIKDQMKLVRCRITNMNPNKSTLRGEIFTVANEFLGTVRKFIPYGEQSEEGWHVPQCLFDNMKEREFYQIKMRKGKNGQLINESKMVREFALEILPQLTTKELNDLRIAQLASAGQE